MDTRHGDVALRHLPPVLVSADDNNAEFSKLKAKAAVFYYYPMKPVAAEELRGVPGMLFRQADADSLTRI